MKLEDPPQDRRRLEIVGAVLAAVIAATAIGFIVFVVRFADDPDASPVDAAFATGTTTSTPSSTSTTRPTAAPADDATLTRPVEVRSGPASDYAMVTRLAATDAINVLGRSSDSEWLVVQSRERPSQIGWIPVDAVADVNVGPLIVVVAPDRPDQSTPEGTASPEATLSPDAPDLALVRAFGQGNVLWVEILNEGGTRTTGELRVSVDGTEVSLEVEPGQPLQSGQYLTAPVPGVHLQLRRDVEVTLLPVDGVTEGNTENNRWSGRVAPDQPNDLEVLGAAIDEDEGHLIVALQNNSPIPITGTFIVSIREAPPASTLISREQVTDEIAAGATVPIPFEDLTVIDLTRASVTLSTDAIEDADLANNTYPGAPEDE